MIDTLKRFLSRARGSEIHQKLRLSVNGRSTPSPYVVLTLHRDSNVDERDHLQTLMRAVWQISREIQIVFPVHPRTRKQLSELHLEVSIEKQNAGIMFLSPLSYLDFIALLEKATFVMTDSGGIQEETTALGVPCLTVRNNTERPVTVTEGTNEIVGTDSAKILAAAEKVLRGESKRGRIPHLWDGCAAQRILHVLEQRFS